MKLRREVRFEAGYDHRDEDAGKPASQRYGCHGLNIRWLLHGDQGSIQFLVYTGWLPSWVRDDEGYPSVRPLPRDTGTWDLFPMAADLGHHWDTPTYEDESSNECDVRPAGACFYDGSGLNAGRVLARLLRDGGEAVWSELEDYYRILAAPKATTA